MPKLEALWSVRDTVTPSALVVTAASLGLILGLRKFRPHWPGFLIAIGAASILSLLLAKAGYPVATIGSRFGGIPSTLPLPALPPFSFEKFNAVLPDALTMALLGGIESLLSAVVADGMSGRRHRSNCELVAQGWRISPRRFSEESAPRAPSRARPPMSAPVRGARLRASSTRSYCSC